MYCIYVCTGFPIALSYPHFMEGDPELVESAEGINPDPKIHTTHFYVNPVSNLKVMTILK